MLVDAVNSYELGPRGVWARLLVSEGHLQMVCQNGLIPRRACVGAFVTNFAPRLGFWAAAGMYPFNGDGG